MESYRLSENAKLDLKRIYIREFRLYSEIQADRYFNEFFERFEQIAEQPLCIQAPPEAQPELWPMML